MSIGHYPAAIHIDYITIASAGNAADFGDLTAPRFLNAGASSPTREYLLQVILLVNHQQQIV